MRPQRGRPTGVLTAVLVAAGLGLAGCGTEGPETRADAGDITDGEHVGEQVTVSAEVSRTLTSDTFEIAGPVDPLLIVEQGELLPALEEEQIVRVTGTVHDDFDVTVVEEEGIDPVTELNVYEGQPYILATSAEIIEQN